MAEPRPLSPAQPVIPTPQPVPVLVVGIVSSAGKSYNHIAGQAKGVKAFYADLNAYLWYSGGGMITLNTGRTGIQRTARGNEDTRDVQR